MSTDRTQDESTSKLLHELLSHELEHRRRGVAPTADEYKARFPDYEQIIDQAFEQYSDQDSTAKAAPVLSNTVDSKESCAAIASRTVTTTQTESGMRYSPKLDRHAEGGMGVVYRALDRELNREVALKEIRQEYAEAPGIRSRFVFEAEVTGALEHPGIVPVYGLGTNVDGRAYYAMRLIEGHSLKEEIAHFHDSKLKECKEPIERELQFRALLRRFIDVCNAVQYAHSRGVLHRDLKPANIVLGRHGETLVVDWGLAKLFPKAERPTGIIEEPTVRPTSSSGTQSSRGGAIGTPQYMSPEQADGRRDAVGPTTDVYSLGATLFSLVTGDLPVDGESIQEVLNNVKSGTIRKARQINASVPRPLEAICQKAMRLEAGDRYSNPRELAEDVERWLAGEAVSAYKDRETCGERTSRWMRKHRSWTYAIAASLLVVAFVSSAAAVVINRSWQDERVAKREALDRFRQSRSAIDKWLTGASDALWYFPGTHAIRDRLLEQAVKDYEQLAEARSADHDVEIERARARLRLGDLHLQQRKFETAEKWYRSALSLFDEVRNRFHDSLDARLGMTNSRAKLGWLFTSMVRHTEAGVEFREAIEQLRDFQHCKVINHRSQKYLRAERR